MRKLNIALIDGAAKALEQRMKACARDISEKYIHPPRTTDFGIMFLPTEGLWPKSFDAQSLVDL